MKIYIAWSVPAWYVDIRYWILHVGIESRHFWVTLLGLEVGVQFK